MIPAAFWVLGAAVGDEVAEAWVGTATELAGERAVRVALERLVVPPIRVVHATVGHQRAERRVFLAAVDAEKRAVLVALEESMPSLPESARMMGAGVREKALCIRVFLSAVLAVFAHDCVSSCLKARLIFPIPSPLVLLPLPLFRIRTWRPFGSSRGPCRGPFPTPSRVRGIARRRTGIRGHPTCFPVVRSSPIAPTGRGLETPTDRV